MEKHQQQHTDLFQKVKYPFAFLQSDGSGNRRPVNLHPLFLFEKHGLVCDPAF